MQIARTAVNVLVELAGAVKVTVGKRGGEFPFRILLKAADGIETQSNPG